MPGGLSAFCDEPLDSRGEGVCALFVVQIYADLDERPASGGERRHELSILFVGNGGLGMDGALCRFSELGFHAAHDGDDFESQRAVFFEEECAAARLGQCHQCAACTVPRWLW